jgi:predicted nucleic acid-binding protein
MRRSFIDAGVLIAAARGTDEVAIRAIEILDDIDREFVSSSFVKLEVLPKAVYNGFEEEVDFYNSFFDNDVAVWVSFSEELVEGANQRAKQFGLGAMDALHITAAISADADEFITTEKPGKPMFRMKDLKVITIHKRRPVTHK